jgi:hypothetical protein
MNRMITDDDIRAFLKKNWSSYPFQVALIQGAVETLWPMGPPEGGLERVVRLCLEEFNVPSGNIHTTAVAH